MPRLLPFRSLHPLVDGRRPAASLIESADPVSLLRKWREAGEVKEVSPPALHVAEVGPAQGARARFVLGVLEGPGADQLETGAGSVPPILPAPGILVDDQRVLFRMLSEVPREAPPQLEASWEDQQIKVWSVSGPAASKLSEAIDEAPVRLLTDTAIKGIRPLVALVPLSDSALRTAPIHRAIRGVATFDDARFRTLVEDYARCYDLEKPLTTEEGQAEALERLAALSSSAHAVLWVAPGGRGTVLRIRQALGLAQLKAVPRNPTLRSLDLSLLNALLLQTVLGIQAPELPGHPQVFTEPTLSGLVDGVEGGKYQAGFALNPTPLWEIRAVIEAGQALPHQTVRLSPLFPLGALYQDPGPT